MRYPEKKTAHQKYQHNQVGRYWMCGHPGDDTFFFGIILRQAAHSLGTPVPWGFFFPDDSRFNSDFEASTRNIIPSTGAARSETIKCSPGFKASFKRTISASRQIRPHLPNFQCLIFTDQPDTGMISQCRARNFKYAVKFAPLDFYPDVLAD